MHQILGFFLLCSLLLITTPQTLSAKKLVHALARTENPDFHSFFPTDLHQQCYNLKLIKIIYEGFKSSSDFFHPRTSAASILSLSNISPSIFAFKKTSSPKNSLILRAQNSYILFDFTPHNSSIDSCTFCNLFHRFSKSSKYLALLQNISQPIASTNHSTPITVDLSTKSSHYLTYSLDIQYGTETVNFYWWDRWWRQLFSTNNLNFLAFLQTREFRYWAADVITDISLRV